MAKQPKGTSPLLFYSFNRLALSKRLTKFSKLRKSGQGSQINTMTTEDCFRIGSILKPKGLKGELHIYVDFDGLENVRFNTIFVEISGKLVPYFIESIKYLQKNSAYLFLEDVDTIEKASL